jgi:hypothetical protein
MASGLDLFAAAMGARYSQRFVTDSTGLAVDGSSVKMISANI